MATEIDVAKVMGTLALAYPKHELTDEQISAYALMLMDIPADALEAGAWICATSGTWFPALAELRKAAVSVMINAFNIPTVGEAWLDVKNQIRICGPYYRGWPGPDQQFPKYSSEITRQVVIEIGYERLCEGENPSADFAQFRDLYQAKVAKLERELNTPESVKQIAARYEEKTSLLLGSKSNPTYESNEVAK